MKIPIKSHTKVRRPMSEHIIDRSGSYQKFSYLGELTEPLPAIVVVQDISTGLENPLFTGVYEYAKPSLSTIVKERFKR